MPRSAGVYSLPAGSLVSNNDVSDASDINTPFSDIEQDLNTARPVTSGGTGETTIADVRDSFGIPHHVGTSAPSYAAKGTLWLDTTLEATIDIAVVKIHNGTAFTYAGKYDTTNNVYYPKGTLIRLTRLTASATHNYHAAAGRMEYRLHAAGGPGGGAQSGSAGRASAGTGGNAGELVEGEFTLSDSVRTSAIVIGAVGAAVAGADGNASSDSTITYDAVTITATGGQPGRYAAFNTSVTTAAPDAASFGTQIGSERRRSTIPGEPAFGLGTTATGSSQALAIGGTGGGDMGGRARALNAATNGQSTGSPGGLGGGGGGGVSINSGTSIAGGTGGGGYIEIREFA